MPPETQGEVVIDGHRCESSWIANKVTVGRYGADFNVIQDAVDYCDSIGGIWTIELYPYGTGLWDEGDITPGGTSIITIRGMDEHVAIAPTVAPAIAVINITDTMYLENLLVVAPDNTRPAVLVNTAAGAPVMTRCIIVGTGVGGYGLQMTQGFIDISYSALSGDTHLSTARCLMDCYHSTILGDIITAAEALNHDIGLMSCELTQGNINSLATGATVIACEGCSNIDVVTNSGTGLFTILGSYVNSVSCLNAGGEIRVRGGTLNSVTRAVGSVVWWRDDSTILVLPSATITDTMITWALAAAGGGKITIRLATGDYEEDNMALVDDVEIVGEGHTVASGSHITINSANPVFTAGAIQASLRSLRITQAGAGEVFLINDAAGVVHTDGVVFASTGGNAVTLTAGTFSAHSSTSNDGDYNLSTADCALILHRSCVDSGNIVTAGAFDHTVTLESVNMNGGSITNGATGATAISIIKCFDINAFTDASLAGTVVIEATIIVAATKSGTSPWIVRIGEFGALTNTNATGEITVYGGTVLSVSCSAGIIRLIDCLYQWINRTATGNIVDQSPFLADMPWHVQKWSWQAALANSQISVRGTPLDAGTGQILLEVTDNVAGSEAVESGAEAAGALSNKLTPARTPRFITQIAHDAFDAHTTAFYGLREVLGDYVPAATEEHAGFVWDGTDFQASSDDGAATETTNLAEPSTDAQHQLEVIIFGGVRVEFYVGGTLVATHTARIPSAALDHQHLLETAGLGGGDAIDVTVRNGGVAECPA